MSSLRPMRGDAPLPYGHTVARRPLADRLHAVDARLFDGVLTAAVIALGVGSQFTRSVTHDELFKDTGVVAVLFGLMTTVPVYWRRRRPLAALAVSCVGIFVVSAGMWRVNNLPIAVLFLTYAVGAHAPRREATIGLGVVVVTIGAIYLSDAPDLNGTETLLNLLLFSGAWLAGQVVQARGATAEARLAEAEERAESARQQEARAIAEERLRLAQELHDVVAHSMSVIAVQAGMGAHVIDQNPEEAKEALAAISDTSRRTLQEMRRLLGVLRDEEGERSHAPAPGLGELPTLVDEVRKAGVDVTLSMDGEPGCVPLGVERSAYRLVQEGLTNVIKHAGPATATVTVHCEPTEVVVEVTDDGRGAAAANGGTGHGLRGMQERVAVWGGSFDAGPRPGGGFRVAARLPFEECS
jgi:signal transduction histidine kinase